MQWLSQIQLFWAVVVTIVGYLGMIVWTVSRPKEYVYAGAPNRKLWRDLRFWATLLLVIQMVIYLLLGI